LTLQVQTLFYSCCIYKKRKIINQNVTVYDEFLRKSTLRLEQGESNILEKTTAENQSGQVKFNF
jgi:cobalt-zinc-cadmium resistance protein CzcA